MHLIAGLALGIWFYLWLGHARFWRIEEDPTPAPPETWPAVTVIIPARNEADLIEETLQSLWRQRYPGPLRVVLVDDCSADATAEVAWRSAKDCGQGAFLDVISARPRPSGWTGKVWALQQGLAHVRSTGLPRYVLFSDADIHHGPVSLEELVARAEAGPCDLASFMVRLQRQSLAERLMIPAFVFFFRLLYPFRRVNDPADLLAAAAGGTMLVRWAALERIGGLAPVRGALIDDCALARAIKRGHHRIWLGLSSQSSSTRRYESLGEIVRMVARTAYTQLDCSPVQLAACSIGLSVAFLAPPLLLLFGSPGAAAAGEAAWLIMAELYIPMVRFYRLPRLWALTLPITAGLYLWATVLSAWNHHRGRGGEWKGRFQG